MYQHVGRTARSPWIVAIVATNALVVTLFGAPSSAWAQVAPPLGTAAAFGVLGNSGVTGAAGLGAVVSGEVGSSPTSTISNFPPSRTTTPFTVRTTNDAVVQQ